MTNRICTVMEDPGRIQLGLRQFFIVVSSNLKACYTHTVSYLVDPFYTVKRLQYCQIGGKFKSRPGAGWSKLLTGYQINCAPELIVRLITSASKRLHSPHPDCLIPLLRFLSSLILYVNSTHVYRISRLLSF